MSNLTVISKALAFTDSTASANPKLKNFDWTRVIENIPVDNPSGIPYNIEPGEELTIFSGARAISADGTTAYTLTLRGTDIYRLTNSAGTPPAFRTDRALTLNGVAVTTVVNSNATLSMTIPGPASFGSTAAGDTIFVPGLSTGDSASPFDTLNEGFWVVLSRISAQSLVLVRPSDQNFSGTSEIATLTANSQLQAFTSSPIIVGDTLDITAGFAAGTRSSYTITAVAPSWVEFVSTVPLALEASIIPGTSGLSIYGTSVRFLRIEADRECAVRLNGDTSSVCRISPITAGDSSAIGWFEKFGTTWQLKIANLSAFRASVLVLRAE